MGGGWEMSQRQKVVMTDVLHFCRLHFLQFDRLPTTREITNHFGWVSQTSAVRWMNVMARCGMVERIHNGHFRFVDPWRDQKVQNFIKGNYK